MNKFMYRNLNNMDVYYEWTEIRSLRTVALRESLLLLLTNSLKREKEKAVKL